jgi:aryl-alcohol dehydrogenase-like predicted oxidoreductase
MTGVMPYRRLGRSGLEVARLGLGTAMFGRTAGAHVASEILSAYIDAGGNMIDTANIYGGSRDNEGNVPGTTEMLVGEITQGRRQRLVIATKGHGSMDRDGWPNSTGLSRIYLRREVEASLRRLRTDYIDLYQFHSWDFSTPIEESIQVMDELIREGKVRYGGVSNWDGWHVVKAAMHARHLGLAPLISNQIWYNLVDRSAENSVIPACHDVGVGIVVWGSLGQGLLSGQYRRGSEQRPLPVHGIDTRSDRGVTSWKRLATESTWNIIDGLERIARAHDSTVATVATQWLLADGACDVVLLGPSRVDEMESHLKGMSLRMSPDEIAGLRDLSAPIPTYPVSMYGRTYDFLQRRGCR